MVTLGDPPVSRGTGVGGAAEPGAGLHGVCGRVRAVVRSKIVTLLLLVAGLLGAGRVAMASESPPRDAAATVHALIARISKAQRSLRSLKARFRQEKKSAMLLEPAVSTGTFVYVAPNRIRWEYRSPDPMVVIFDGHVLSTWDPVARHLDRVKVSPRQRRLMEVLAGARPLEQLASHFSIALVTTPEDEPWELRLEPVERRLKEKIEKIELRVDRKLDLPVEITSVEADGDSTSYRFSHLEINPPVDPSVFVLNPSGKVTVETYDASEGP